MSSPDDEVGEMRRFPFFRDDRVLSGDLDPDDAPPELARIAGLVRAARTPELSSELAGEELLVSQVAAVVRESRRVEVARDDRRHVLGGMLSAKVIGATAAVLLSGGVAAAATGALPNPVQEAVSHGLAHVGISVPDPAAPEHSATQHSPVQPTSTATAGASGIKHSTTTATRYGLCTAFAHASNPKARADALSKLTAAAKAHDETVNQYCQGAIPPSTALGANPGSTHRRSTTPVSSSTPAGKSAGHTPAGRGSKRRPTTTVTVPPSSKAHDANSSKAQAGKTSANDKAPKSATAPSGPRRSSRDNNSTSHTVASSTTTTSTSLPVTAQDHSSTSSDNGEGVSSVHTP